MVVPTRVAVRTFFSSAVTWRSVSAASDVDAIVMKWLPPSRGFFLLARLAYATIVQQDQTTGRVAIRDIEHQVRRRRAYKAGMLQCRSRTKSAWSRAAPAGSARRW